MSDPFVASSVSPCRGPQSFGSTGRRGFLRMGLGGFASLSLPGILRRQAAAAANDAAAERPQREQTALIMVWKPGGCSHIDTYAPQQ